MIKIYDYEKIGLDDIFARESEDTSSIESTVAQIIENVKENGDEALRFYADKFDGGAPESLEVTKEEIEKAMSEVPAIVDLLTHQKAELSALALHHQKELNDAVASNPDLATEVENVKEARKAFMERQQMFDQEMFKAKYMTPVIITPEPEVDEDGNIKLAEGSKISMQVLPIKNQEMKGIMMAFTDAKEFQKWDKAAGLHTLSITMQELFGNVLKDPKLAGVAINPFGANVIIPRERMEMMVKAAMNQKQAAMANKNVEVVEANINE